VTCHRCKSDNMLRLFKQCGGAYSYRCNECNAITLPRDHVSEFYERMGREITGIRA
jgi:hypothetical protein